MKRNAILFIACVVLLVGAVWLTAHQRTATPEIRPAELTATPEIHPAELTARQLAGALGLNVWHFEVDLPPAQYDLYVWAETWFRDADEPEIHEMGIMGTGIRTIEGVQSLVVKLPKRQEDKASVAFASMTMRPSMQYVIGDMDEVVSHSSIEIYPPGPIELGEPARLIGIGASMSEDGVVSGVFGDAAEQLNDLTQYICVQITPAEEGEESRMSPVYRDGQVRLEPRN